MRLSNNSYWLDLSHMIWFSPLIGQLSDKFSGRTKTVLHIQTRRTRWGGWWRRWRWWRWRHCQGQRKIFPVHENDYHRLLNWISMQSVHEKLKHDWYLCDHQAGTQASLKYHVQSAHEKIKYPCDLCHYQATKQGDLKRHIQSVH